MNIRKVTSNAIHKVDKAAMTAMTTVMAIAYNAPVRAAGTEDAGTEVSAVTIKEGANAGTVVSNVLGIILLYAQYIGAALLIWGLVMFAMAVKSDEPESKQKALATAIAGIIAMTLRSILRAAKIIN